MVHFVRNILARIPYKDKDAFAQNLKTPWLVPIREQASANWPEKICRQYEYRFPKAVRCLEDSLEDSLAFYVFRSWTQEGFLLPIMYWKRLNREIRCRTGMVGIFPSADAYTRLVTIYRMEYAEDWSATRAYLSEQSVQTMLRPAA